MVIPDLSQIHTTPHSTEHAESHFPLFSSAASQGQPTMGQYGGMAPYGGMGMGQQPMQPYGSMGQQPMAPYGGAMGRPPMGGMGQPQVNSWLYKTQTSPAFSPPAPAEAAASWANHASVANDKAHDALRDIEQIKADAMQQVSALQANAENIMKKLELSRNSTMEELKQQSSLVWNNYTAAQAAVAKMMKSAEAQAMAAKQLVMKANDAGRVMKLGNDMKHGGAGVKAAGIGGHSSVKPEKTTSHFAELDKTTAGDAAAAASTAPTTTPAPSGSEDSAGGDGVDPPDAEDVGTTASAGTAVTPTDTVPGAEGVGTTANAGTTETPADSVPNAEDVGTTEKAGTTVASTGTVPNTVDVGTTVPAKASTAVTATETAPDAATSTDANGDSDDVLPAPVADTAKTAKAATVGTATDSDTSGDVAEDGETAVAGGSAASGNEELDAVLAMIRKYVAKMNPPAATSGVTAKAHPGHHGHHSKDPVSANVDGDDIGNIASKTARVSKLDSQSKHDAKMSHLKAGAKSSIASIPGEADVLRLGAELNKQVLGFDTASAVSASLKAAKDLVDQMTAKEMDSEREMLIYVQQAQQAMIDAANTASKAEIVANKAANFANDMASRASYSQNAAGQAMAAQMAQAMGFPVAVRGEPSPFPPVMEQSTGIACMHAIPLFHNQALRTRAAAFI